MIYVLKMPMIFVFNLKKISSLDSKQSRSEYILDNKFIWEMVKSLQTLQSS